MTLSPGEVEGHIARIRAAGFTGPIICRYLLVLSVITHEVVV